MNIIIKSLDSSANDETRKVAQNLTEEEAELFATILDSRLQGKFKNQSNSITTIQNLKRVDNAISYRLSGANAIWSNCSIAPFDDKD